MQNRNSCTFSFVVIGALLLLVPEFTTTASAQKSDMEIRDVEARQSGDTLEVSYTVDTESPTGRNYKQVEVELEVSSDYGESYSIDPSALDGDIGEVKGDGNRKRVFWDVLSDFPEGIEGQGYKFRIVGRFEKGYTPAPGQRVLSEQKSSPPIEVDIQPNGKEEKTPATLIASADFQDASGDDLLDAGEQGKLLVSIANRGNKSLRNVTLSVSPQVNSEGLQVGSENHVLKPGTSPRLGQFSNLASGTIKQTVIPLKAPSSLPEGDFRLAIEAEADGGTSSIETITIPAGAATSDEKSAVAEQEAPSERAAPGKPAEDASEDDSLPVVDREIPETNVERPNGIAVVIGNEEYKNTDIPNVDYAARDAEVMKKYLIRTLGFREENVIYVENATAAAMTRIFGTEGNPQGQLYNWVKPGESSVFVYYSGHGAPNPESGSPYFIPTDTNPNYLSQNGYPVNQLYENLAQLPAETVTVVVEACFSGVSESGAVVSDISPAVLSVENPVMGLENGLAFTAGAADQVSTWYNEKRHGLFTYYFLKGLRGEADANGDDAIKAKEIKQYVGEEVPYRARRLHNREQTPQVIGQDLDRVVVQYEETAPAAQPEARLPATTTTMDKSVKEALSLPGGAVKVTSGSSLEALQEGDVIVAVSGSDLREKGQLMEVISQLAPGDTLQLTILRDGRSQAVSVTLTAQ